MSNNKKRFSIKKLFRCLIAILFVVAVLFIILDKNLQKRISDFFTPKQEQTTNNAQITELQNQIETLNMSLNEMVYIMADKNEQIQIMTFSLAEANEELETQRETITILTDKVEIKTEEATRLKIENETLRAELETLKSDIESNKERIEEIENQIFNNTSAIENLESEINDFNVQLQALNLKVEENEIKISSIQNSISALKIDIESLEESVEVLNQNITNLFNKIDEIEADSMTYTCIDATELDENTYYPVIFVLPQAQYVRIELRNQWNGGNPSWSTHSTKNYSCYKVWETNGSSWGQSPINRTIYASSYSWVASDPVRGLGQLSTTSVEYVFVRGGGIYNFYCSNGIIPEIKTATYWGYDNQSVSPTTTAPAEIRTNINKVISISLLGVNNGVSYVKFDNGLILQWGRTTALNGYAKEIDFAISFSSVNSYSVMASTTNLNGYAHAIAQPKTADYFYLVVRYQGTTYAEEANWFAIGY